MNIVSRNEFSSVVESEIGSKAYKLLDLQDAGFNVPSLVAVHKDVCRHHLAACAPSELTVESVAQMGVDASFRAELADYLDPQKKYAVRSSAIGEDGVGCSYAGQLTSVLSAPASRVADEVPVVWASAYAEHVADYRRNHGGHDEALEVAVVVQEMIEAEASGVAFAIDPVSGDRETVVVASVFGLGEGLVSGELDADTFKIKDGQVQVELANKTHAVASNCIATKRVELPADKQGAASISEAQAREIAKITRDVSDYYGKPQDIEWAIYQGQIFVLQSRPVTTLGLNPDRRQQHRLWDNSNIVESYSGISGTLTFSFVQDVYTHVYQQFCLMMGVEKELIHANQSIFQMLGLVRGRIYYNLLNWYKVLSLLPGYSLNAAFMEQMMGVSEKIDFPPVIQSRKNQYLRVTRMIGSLVLNLVRLPGQTTAFYERLDRVLAPYSVAEPLGDSSLTLDALADEYRRLERELLEHWQAPLVNDFFAMIFFGLLKKSMEKWDVDDSGMLQNDLLCGEGGIISTEPIKSLQRIANKVVRHDRLRAAILDETDEGFLVALESAPGVSRCFHKHANRFGDRCVDELKLETITAKQDPRILVRMLRNYVKAGYQDLAAGADHEQAVRTAAEERLANKLSGHPIRRLLCWFYLKKTRELVKNRENLRFERTRVFAAVRIIFTRIGEGFYAEGMLEDPRDIFFLTKDEVFNYLNGALVDDGLQQLANARKASYAVYKEEKDPAARFPTWGPLGHANRYSAPPAGPVKDGSLSGVGCSPGIVEGTVVRVTDPNDASELDGNILVAHHTDPGWAPLFRLATGILVERGSLLSHSAIVAREMGIPAIVGVPNLMEQLKTGDRIEFDGSTGRITVLEPAAEGADHV